MLSMGSSKVVVESLVNHLNEVTCVSAWFCSTKKGTTFNVYCAFHCHLFSMFEYTLSWLVTILLVNIVLLYFAWQTYGQRINITILKKEEKDLIFGRLICRLYDLYKLCQQKDLLYL